MKQIKGTLDFYEKEKCVITLGKFDGLHRGHQALLDRVLSYQDPGAVRTVFAFDTSPISLLTKKERKQMLKKRGIQLLIECPFVAELISMEPETFVKRMLVDQLHAVHIVVGRDFRFGYRRTGDVHTLKELGEKYGFTVEIVEKVRDESKEISSTYIREELAKGNMEKVNELLGYEYSITGEVVQGRQVGRTIGIPTTNLIPPKDKLLPPNGVYATETVIGDKTYEGMTNIGCKPTVEGSFIGIETHLFSYTGDLYGEKETVRLLHYVRPEVKFESVTRLSEQLKKDAETIKKLFTH